MTFTTKCKHTLECVLLTLEITMPTKGLHLYLNPLNSIENFNEHPPKDITSLVPSIFVCTGISQSSWHGILRFQHINKIFFFFLHTFGYQQLLHFFVEWQECMQSLLNEFTALFHLSSWSISVGSLLTSLNLSSSRSSHLQSLAMQLRIC